MESGWAKARGLAIKTALLIGGALLLKRLTKSTTRWDHARLVADSLCGEKNSKGQAVRDPDHYFNLRLITCPAAQMVDGSKVLYFEQASGITYWVSECNTLKLTLWSYWCFSFNDQAFWRMPQKPFRQRFYMVKPCQKEMKCDVEVRTYSIRDMEEYKNFCDRPKDQRSLPDEVIGDIAEHLTTIYLKRCERGKRCLYEGSTPPGGFPNSWNGAAYCTSELAILKNNEVHGWDKGYDDEGNHVWGVKEGPYGFKPAPVSSFSDMSLPLNQSPLLSLENRIEGSFVLQG
ncbi:Chromophore lyase CRL, chloroplastic-like protein [Drosera capensis]